jgi:hypothetical protein
MALSKVSTGASFDNGGSAWSTTDHTKDTGSAIGDLAVIVVSFYENGDKNVNTPTGFTDQGSFVVGGTGTDESRLDVFTRVIDGTEGATFTVSINGGSIFGTTQLLTIRGSSALSVASVTAGTAAAGVTSIAAPSVSGTDGQGLLAAYGIGDPAGTYTDPSGMTLGISEGTEATNTGRVYYETLTATGATGTRTLSWTNTRDAIGVSILVNGAGAGGGGPTGRGRLVGGKLVGGNLLVRRL